MPKDKPTTCTFLNRVECLRALQEHVVVDAGVIAEREGKDLHKDAAQGSPQGCGTDLSDNDHEADVGNEVYRADVDNESDHA